MCDEAFFLVPDDSFFMVTSPHSIMRDGALFPMCDSASFRTRERLLFPPFFHERRSSSHVSDAPWTHSVRDDASFSCANAFSLCARYYGLTQRATAPSLRFFHPHSVRHGASFLARINAFPFMTDGAPSHLREALWTQSVRNGTLFLVRDGALFPCAPCAGTLSCAIAPPPSCGISFPCATASNGAALVSDGAFTHCTSFLVWNMILPMCDSTLLFTRDGAAFSLPMGPSLSVPSASCSRTPAVSFIVRDGGLFPSVTVPFISCARQHSPSSRVTPGEVP
ncbi:hypothetical protein B0H13DRAFT_2377658 [Mycena leptocephala]|nr:hypothetical protein B0H13DRAFT_2377658 [Mycena leptocephala]